MKNSKTLLEKVEKLERMAESIKGEIALLDYCRDNGLNFDDSADYEQAEMKVHYSRHKTEGVKAGEIGNFSDTALPYRNRVDNGSSGAYNEITKCVTSTEEPCASEYSWLSSINRLRHSVQQKLIGRVVVNRTGVRIAVMAQPRTARNTTGAVYLSPGESSAGKYEDVDAIMIARGQRFYKSKADAMAKNKEIVDAGAIKVHDGVKIAEVRHTPGKPDVFYVDATDSIYFEENHYPDSRWRLP